MPRTLMFYLDQRARAAKPKTLLGAMLGKEKGGQATSLSSLCRVNQANNPISLGF
jgi:hypothetical protein